MAITNEQKEALEQSIVSPEEEVRHSDGRMLRQRSVDEQIKAYNFATSQQSVANGTKRNRQVRISSSKGLD